MPNHSVYIHYYLQQNMHFKIKHLIQGIVQQIRISNIYVLDNENIGNILKLIWIQKVEMLLG